MYHSFFRHCRIMFPVLWLLLLNIYVKIKEGYSSRGHYETENRYKYN